MTQIRIILTMTMLFASPLKAEKIGLILGSFGDVDSKEEIEEFVKNTLNDPDILPLPKPLRQIIAKGGWLIDKNNVYKRYESFGWKTAFRENSRYQANFIANKLKEKGYDASAYIGFSMTSPYVHDAVDKAYKDGIETLILSHQGAQHSKVTSGILFRDTMNAIKNYPDWNVRVIGIKSFSDDKRFVDLIVNNIKEDLQKLPKTDDDKTCILLPVHGNLQKLVNAGDPSIDQMLDVIDNVKQRLPSYHYHYGFQNHDEIPLIQWTKPNIHNETHRIAQDLCDRYLISGRISFTVDNVETLFDQAIEFKNDIENSLKMQNRKEVPIYVSKMFNKEHSFLNFMADIVEESLSGNGDLVILK